METGVKYPIVDGAIRLSVVAGDFNDFSMTAIIALNYFILFLGSRCMRKINFAGISDCFISGDWIKDNFRLDVRTLQKAEASKHWTGL